jgi:hypothetical protein
LPVINDLGGRRGGQRRAPHRAGCRGLPDAIGFEGRWEYACIGTVVNIASRLCTKPRMDKFLSIRNPEPD